jgi:hypothetical protein
VETREEFEARTRAELIVELEAKLEDEVERQVEEKSAEIYARARLDRARDTASMRSTVRNCRDLIDAEDELIKTTDPERYGEMVACGQASWQEAYMDDYDMEYDEPGFDPGPEWYD